MGWHTGYRFLFVAHLDLDGSFRLEGYLFLKSKMDHKALSWMFLHFS